MAHQICCSIEMEPRTLNEGQLNHAREAAVDIVEKNKLDEASNIFIEGLMPVVTIKEMEQIVERRHELQKLLVHHCKHAKASDDIHGKQYNCSCNTAISDESPKVVNVSKIREPFTAPF